MPDRVALIIARVLALILERPMCADCIATRAPTTPTAVESALLEIAVVLSLQRDTGRCHTCGAITSVVSVHRSVNDPRRP